MAHSDRGIRTAAERMRATGGLAVARSRAAQNALSAIEPPRRTLIEERALQIPKAYQTGYLRAAAGRGPIRAAVKAHCLECMSWVRAEVTRCPSLACPLWSYRPYRDDE